MKINAVKSNEYIVSKLHVSNIMIEIDTKQNFSSSSPSDRKLMHLFRSLLQSFHAPIDDYLS